MHEFLVLHYMATDSAEEWDTFLDLCLPQCTWIRAGSRRALALHMFDKCHVAPSHRRLAHPSWIACSLVPVKNGTCDHALSTIYLLKSMFVASQLALTAAFASSAFCGACLMSRSGVYWVALLFLQCYCMGFRPNMGPSSWSSTSLLTDCANGILMMTHCAPFHANIASWIVVHWSCENISALVNILMDTGLTFTCHMADFPCGSYCVKILKLPIPNVVTLPR